MSVGDDPNLRIQPAAAPLGVTDDTVRRWIQQGALPVSRDPSSRKVIASDVLAEFASRTAPAPAPDPLGVRNSARNRSVGLVTKVTNDTVLTQDTMMTQVEMQRGPFSVVSPMSTAAAQELQLTYPAFR